MLEPCESFVDIDINSDNEASQKDLNNNNSSLIIQKSKRKSFDFLRRISLNQTIIDKNLFETDQEDEIIYLDLVKLKRIQHNDDEDGDLEDDRSVFNDNELKSNEIIFDQYLTSTPRVSSNLSTLSNDDSIMSFPNLVDSLLEQIYDRFNSTCVDSDVFTEFTISTSRMSELDCESSMRQFIHSKKNLSTKSIAELKQFTNELNHKITKVSAKLIKNLKLKDKLVAKQKNNFDLITAVLQAISLKRREDTQMKFSISPPSDEQGYQQWLDCVRALCRFPEGIPKCFRKNIWLSCAKNYIKEIQLDWKNTLRFAFNDKTNPDDDQLGLQIVKDLHRTGCSLFDNKEDRALLKRVLLAYARFNKAIGYCQGFNIIVALILEIVDKKEDDALMIMIYLIDCIIPSGYFSNALYTLSIDMIVFRELLKLKLPKLYEKLAQLQQNDNAYEPPLTNVFTMQWFLTLFATCLPKSLVLRIWDSLMIECNVNMLFRVSLVIWDQLSESLIKCSNADNFYTLMSELSSQLLDESTFDERLFIKKVYSFDKLNITSLREKFTFNITPFQSAKSNQTQSSIEPISCFHLIHKNDDTLKNDDNKSPDISTITPGAYSLIPQIHTPKPIDANLTMNLNELKKQYEKLKQRQQQACIIIQTAHDRHKEQNILEKQESTNHVPCNHLLMKPIDKNKNTLKQNVSFKVDAEIRHKIDFNQRVVTYNPFNTQPLSSQVIKNGMKLGLYK